MIQLDIDLLAGVSSTTRCTWCKNDVRDDYSHTIECASAQKGDTNRRHQFFQHWQVSTALLKTIKETAVHLVLQSSPSL